MRKSVWIGLAILNVCILGWLFYQSTLMSRSLARIETELALAKLPVEEIRHTTSQIRANQAYDEETAKEHEDQ